MTNELPRPAATGAEASDPASARSASEAVLFEIRRVIVGQDVLLERLLVALVSNGHGRYQEQGDDLCLAGEQRNRAQDLRHGIDDARAGESGSQEPHEGQAELDDGEKASGVRFETLHSPSAAPVLVHHLLDA